MKNGALIAVFSLLASVPLARADPLAKPVVQVRFDLAEENYAAAFLDEDETLLVDDLSLALAEVLKDRIGFIDFTLENKDDFLLIKLGKRSNEPGSDGIRPVYFWVSAEGPRVHDSGQVDWLFRALDRSADAPGSSINFAEEVLTAFEGHLKSDHDRLVEKVLSKIVLADHAHPWSAHERWVLPYSRLELRVDHDTAFTIRARVSKGGVSSLAKQTAIDIGDIEPPNPDIPSHFHHKIVAELEGEPQLATADSVEAQEIYLIRYHRLSDHLLTPVPPSQVSEEQQP